MTQPPWVLFLDDVRDPPSGLCCLVARSMDEAVLLLETRGAPIKVHFDHDLGDGTPTGLDFAKLLVERDLDAQGLYLPLQFTFVVHSDNPPGAKNITGLLDGYLGFKNRKTVLPKP